MRLAVAVLFALVVFMQCPAAEARMRFGSDDLLVFVEKSGAKGPNGEALYLARKIRTEHFLLPYTVSDDGYVLGVAGKKEFYSLDEAKIKSLQAQKLLPNPLPPYKMELLDLAMGHLLWILIAVLAIWGGISVLWKRRNSAKAA